MPEDPDPPENQPDPPSAPKTAARKGKSPEQILYEKRLAKVEDDVGGMKSTLDEINGLLEKLELGKKTPAPAPGKQKGFFDDILDFSE